MQLFLNILFLCVAASKRISCFLSNVRLLLKEIKKMCSCFLKLCPLKCSEVKQLKIKTMLRYFWLNYCDENHIKRILIAVKNIDPLFHLVSETIEADRRHVFYLSGGTRNDDNEYLESLENGAELIVCAEQQI